MFGGNFFVASISAYNIASWNGSSWNILGASSSNNGVGGSVYALAMNGSNQLFVGGQFTSINGSISTNNIASWDGNSWSILGTSSTNNGVNGQVNALAMNGTNQLFVGGNFTSVDELSIPTNYIASWNGTSWNIFGSNSANNGFNNIVLSLALNGTDLLYAGGQFTSTFEYSCSPYITLFGKKKSHNLIELIFYYSNCR